MQPAGRQCRCSGYAAASGDAGIDRARDLHAELNYIPVECHTCSLGRARSHSRSHTCRRHLSQRGSCHLLPRLCGIRCLAGPACRPEVGSMAEARQAGDGNSVADQRRSSRRGPLLRLDVRSAQGQRRGLLLTKVRASPNAKPVVPNQCGQSRGADHRPANATVWTGRG